MQDASLFQRIQRVSSAGLQFAAGMQDASLFQRIQRVGCWLDELAGKSVSLTLHAPHRAVLVDRL
jgi:hypothetical protein